MKSFAKNLLASTAALAVCLAVVGNASAQCGVRQGAGQCGVPNVSNQNLQIADQINSTAALSSQALIGQVATQPAANVNGLPAVTLSPQVLPQGFPNVAASSVTVPGVAVPSAPQVVYVMPQAVPAAAPAAVTAQASVAQAPAVTVPQVSPVSGRTFAKSVTRTGGFRILPLRRSKSVSKSVSANCG